MKYKCNLRYLQMIIQFQGVYVSNDRIQAKIKLLDENGLYAMNHRLLHYHYYI